MRPSASGSFDPYPLDVTVIGGSGASDWSDILKTEIEMQKTEIDIRKAEIEYMKQKIEWKRRNEMI